MNKKKKIVIILSIVFLIALLIVIPVSSNNLTVNLYEDGSLSDEEAIKFVSDLTQKDLKTLLNEADELDYSTISEDVVGYYYEAIRIKLTDVPVSEIIKYLLNEKLSVEIKTSVLMLCDMLNISVDYENFISLLKDPDVPKSYRNFLMSQMVADGEKYTSVIEDIARSYDNPDIFIENSLSYLQYLNPKKGMEIADEILADLSSANTDKYKAALIAKSDYFCRNRNNNDPEELKNFIDVCDKFLNAPEFSDEYKRSVVIYSLKKANQKETFSYLMLSENEIIQNEISVIVGDNKNVIEEILNETPESQNIRVLSKAAPYYDEAEKLEQYVKQNDDYFNLHTEEKLILSEVTK